MERDGTPLTGQNLHHPLHHKLSVIRTLHHQAQHVASMTEGKVKKQKHIKEQNREENNSPHTADTVRNEIMMYFKSFCSCFLKDMSHCGPNQLLFPCTNKYLQRKWDKSAQDLHKQKVTEVLLVSK